MKMDYKTFLVVEYFENNLQEAAVIAKGLNNLNTEEFKRLLKLFDDSADMLERLQEIEEEWRSQKARFSLEEIKNAVTFFIEQTEIKDETAIIYYVAHRLGMGALNWAEMDLVEEVLS